VALLESLSECLSAFWQHWIKFSCLSIVLIHVVVYISVYEWSPDYSCLSPWQFYEHSEHCDNSDSCYSFQYKDFESFNTWEWYHFIYYALVLAVFKYQQSYIFCLSMAFLVHWTLPHDSGKWWERGWLRVLAEFWRSNLKVPLHWTDIMEPPDWKWWKMRRIFTITYLLKGKSIGYCIVSLGV